MIAPDLLPRREFNDPDAALAHARAIYETGVSHLRRHLQAFLDGEVPGERVRATYLDNYDRLASTKAKYDPENVFRVNQNIKPKAA